MTDQMYCKTRNGWHLPNRMTKYLPLLIVGLLSCVAEIAIAAERLGATRANRFVPIELEAGQPKFQIPQDSPLARNEHPRMVLVAGDLDQLRARLKDPRIAPEFEAIQRQAQGDWKPESHSFRHALLFRLTGERKYLDAIRRSPEFKRPTWIFGWAATMDLIWEELAVEERRELSDLVAKAVAKDGSLYWRPTLHLMVVFYEGGKGPNDAAFLQRMRQDYQQTIIDWTGKLNRWAAGRGGSDMSHGYNGEHAYWEPFVAAIAWSHPTGQDYIGRADFARYQSAFYWYHLIPGLEPLTVEKIGVTRTSDDASAVTPAHCGANDLLFLTFTRENDGLGLAWMEKYRTQEPHWNKDREALGRLLWWDPDQKPLDPATLPLTRLFPTSGHVIMRSDWGDDATFATFRCGRFGEIDGTWGRNNADNLSFTIRKRGPLAIDSGPVHGQNTTVLKFLGQGADSGVPAIGNYGRQTIAHNSITIGDGRYTHLDWKGNPICSVRRGGQSVPQAKDWWSKWGFTGPQKDFMQGRITAYRTHPLYDYACGDARFSYPPEFGVEEITRQFVYLKPDVFVVYDRLALADGAGVPCWMLHSLREPKSVGDEKPLTPAEIGPQFWFDGKEPVPHPKPGGHFTMGGDSFTVDSGSPGKSAGGRLAVRTLYPAPQDCQRKKIGGKDHDFEVEGVQYGLTEEGYKMTDSGYAVGSTIGLQGWRVELRPRAAGRTVEFLHLMQVGMEGQKPEPVQQATCQSAADGHLITLKHGTRQYAVRLSRTGPRGGSIRITGGGTDMEQTLPDAAEDHWRHFSADPQYKTWTTDPRYRVVVGPPEHGQR